MSNLFTFFQICFFLKQAMQKLLLQLFFMFLHYYFLKISISLKNNFIKRRMNIYGHISYMIIYVYKYFSLYIFIHMHKKFFTGGGGLFEHFNRCPYLDFTFTMFFY